jgi:hypothetical protein
MKNRLVKELSKKKGEGQIDLSEIVRESLMKNNFEEAIE